MSQQQGRRTKGLWNVPSRSSGKPPSPRWGHTTTYVTRTDSMPYLFVYGGWDGSEALGDLYYYSLKDQVWIAPEITGQRPRANSGHTMCNIHSILPYHLILIGGDQNDLRELWLYNIQNDTWKKKKTQSSHNIYLQGDLMVNERFIEKIREDKTKEGKGEGEDVEEEVGENGKGKSPQEVFLGSHSVEVQDTGFGTPSKNAIINDRYRVKVKMKFPDTRSRHTSTYVPHLEKVFVFGGGSSVGGKNRVFDDLWTLDVRTFVWERQKTIGRVDALWGHSATLVGKSIYIFGGCHNTSMMNDLFRLDTDTYTWDKLRIDASVVPAPRAAHSCVRYGKNLIILWGGDNSLFLDDMYIINCETYVCKKLSFSKPKARCAHTASVVGDFMYVLGGGRDWRKRFKELYAVNLEYAIEKSGINSLVEKKKGEIEEMKRLYGIRDVMGSSPPPPTELPPVPPPQPKDNNSVYKEEEEGEGEGEEEVEEEKEDEEVVVKKQQVLELQPGNTSSTEGGGGIKEEIIKPEEDLEELEEEEEEEEVIMDEQGKHPPAPPPLPDNFESLPNVDSKRRRKGSVNKVKRRNSDGLRGFAYDRDGGSRRRSRKSTNNFIPLTGGVYVDREYVNREEDEHHSHKQYRPPLYRGRDRPSRDSKHGRPKDGGGRLDWEGPRQKPNHNDMTGNNKTSKRSVVPSPNMDDNRKKYQPRKMNPYEEIQRDHLRTEIERHRGSRYIPRQKFKSTEGEEDLPIARWLSSIGLKKYTRIFILNEVSMNSLEYLKEEDLIQIGISKVGPRKVILNELAKVKSDNQKKKNGGGGIDILRQDVERLRVQVDGMKNQITEFILLMKQQQQVVKVPSPHTSVLGGYHHPESMLAPNTHHQHHQTPVKTIPVYIPTPAYTYQSPHHMIHAVSPTTTYPQPQQLMNNQPMMIQQQQQQQQQQYTNNNNNNNINSFHPSPLRTNNYNGGGLPPPPPRSGNYSNPPPQQIHNHGRGYQYNNNNNNSDRSFLGNINNLDYNNSNNNVGHEQQQQQQPQQTQQYQPHRHYRRLQDHRRHMNQSSNPQIHDNSRFTDEHQQQQQQQEQEQQETQPRSQPQREEGNSGYYMGGNDKQGNVENQQEE